MRSFVSGFPCGGYGGGGVGNEVWTGEAPSSVDIGSVPGCG